MWAGKVVGVRRKMLRRFEDGSVRFLTFSCYGRAPLLSSRAARDIVQDQLGRHVLRGQCNLHAYVLMPSHVHLLLTPSEGIKVSALLSGLKTTTARRVNELLGTAGAPFWLPGGGYDRNILTRDEYLEKLVYIHNNPVASGLVETDAEWGHSSAAAYAGMPYNGPRLSFLNIDFRW